MFEELAQHLAKQDQPRHRDHCWVLAADAALGAANAADADFAKAGAVEGESASSSSSLRQHGRRDEVGGRAGIHLRSSGAMAFRTGRNDVAAGWGCDKKPTASQSSLLRLSHRRTAKIGANSSSTEKKRTAGDRKGTDVDGREKIGEALSGRPHADPPCNGPRVLRRLFRQRPSLHPEVDAPSATLPNNDKRNALWERGLANFVFLLGLVTATKFFFSLLFGPS